MRPDDYSFLRYLRAKKSVDDRALNLRVLESLGMEMATMGDKVVRILEVGAGIGTMAMRLIEQGVVGRAEYRVTDLDSDTLAAGRAYVSEWAKSKGLLMGSKENTLELQVNGIDIRLVFEVQDAMGGQVNANERADVLIANAVLDLLDLKPALEKLLAQVQQGGLCYFSINYDGMTLFEPEIDAGLDADIRRLYDRTMDLRMTDGKPSGDSRTGRHMFEAIKQVGAEVLAAGSSDWVVYASGGKYLHDEAYFLHFILNTVYSALKDNPGMDVSALETWVETRHAQVERGELVYIAHQLDFLARK